MNNSKSHQMELNNSIFKDIIEGVLDQVEIERIYLNRYRKGDSEDKYQLLLLVADHHHGSLLDLEPLINIHFDGKTNIYPRLYYANQVKEGLENGNLYFHFCCTASNLVFSKSDSLLPLYGPSESIFEKIKRNYEGLMTKINPFADGMDFYLTKENYGHAAFMLHQVIELTFRALELSMMGKEKRTHRIHAHQRYLGSYIADLDGIFSANSEEDKLQFKLLEDAYTAVRYKNEFKIDRYTIDRLSLKAHQLKQMGNSVFEAMLGNLQIG